MEPIDYYEDIGSPEFYLNLHNRVKDSMTLDDLASVVVCLILQTDNHQTVEDKINELAKNDCGTRI